MRYGAQPAGSRASAAAVVLAVAGVAFAAIAAIGPAERERSIFSWPSRPLPEFGGAAWSTALPLAKRVPERIDVDVPCALRGGERGDDRTLTILETARRVRRLDGLSIVASGGSLDVRVGARRILRTRWPPASGGCPARLRLEGGLLRVSGRVVPVASDQPNSMPTVSALRSEVDFRAHDDFAVEVETTTYASSPAPRQVVAAGASIAMIASALLLVLLPALRSARPRRLSRTVRPQGSLGAVDAVVVAILVAWFVLVPAFVDDGWVSTRQLTFERLGAFSNLYDSYGANLPLFYWLEWLERWLYTTTDQIAFMRIPSLVALIAGWVAVRWCIRRAVGVDAPSGALWSGAATFTLLAMAWGMTLRPEPFVGLLVVVALAAMLSFAGAPRVAPLAVAAVAAALAVTAHPAGLTAGAAILAVAPSVWRAMRAAVVPATSVVAVGASALALVLLLLFLDTDVASWQADRKLLEHSPYYSDAWWREFDRYTQLIERNWGTPVRVLSTFVPLIIGLAYLTRARRRTASPLLSVPGRSLVIALGLLFFTPSKNPYHLGAIASLAAVAAASETAAFLTEGGRSRRIALRPFVGAGLVAFGFAVAAQERNTWGSLDLVTTSWDVALERYFPSDFAPLIGLAFVSCVWVIILVEGAMRGRAGRPALTRRPWHFVGWALPGAALPLVALTLLVLARDAANAPGWAQARQHLAALSGEPGCGAATLITAERARDAASLDAALRGRGGTVLADPSLATHFPCIEPPALELGLARTPDYVVAWDVPWIVTRGTSAWAAVGDMYRLRRIGGDGQRVAVFAVERASRGEAPARVERRPA